MRVETRPESEEDPPPRAEPTFESLCANISQLGFLERVERRRWRFNLRLWERGRSKCPVDEVSVNKIHHRILDFTYTSIDERWRTEGLHDGWVVHVLGWIG
jgi:hypothetical protein